MIGESCSLTDTPEERLKHKSLKSSKKMPEKQEAFIILIL